MPAFYVKPYVKRGKTDAVDAAAICEAVMANKTARIIWAVLTRDTEYRRSTA